MNQQKRKELVNWLIQNYSDREAQIAENIVLEMIKMRAPEWNPREMLSYLKKACTTVAGRGSVVNAKILTFVSLQLGSGLWQNVISTEDGLSNLGEGLESRVFTENDVIDAILGGPLHHLESNIFETFLTNIAYAPDLALISYFLLSTIFGSDELSAFKMLPD